MNANKPPSPQSTPSPHGYAVDQKVSLGLFNFRFIIADVTLELEYNAKCGLELVVKF